MLEIIDLTKKYDKSLAVDHLNLAVKSGEVGVLLGPTGPARAPPSSVLRVYCGSRAKSASAATAIRLLKPSGVLAMCQRCRSCMNT